MARKNKKQKRMKQRTAKKELVNSAFLLPSGTSKRMANKFLMVGHKHSKLKDSSQMMQELGIAYASDSKKNTLDPKEISRTILKAEKQNLKKDTQLSVPKVWDALAMDLFRANLGKKVWFWEDSKAINLLEYWRNLDANMGFVLVYTDPKSMLMNALSKTEKISPKKVNKLLLDWQQYNSTLLHFFYRNKERALLVNDKQLLGHTPAYLNTISHKIGFTLNGKKLQKMPSTQKSVSHLNNKENTAVDFMVLALLEEYPQVRELYEELQGVANVYDRQAHFEKRDPKKAFCELVSLHKEKEQVSQDLTKTLESHVNLEKEQLVLKEETAKQRETVNASKEENNLLLTQLHQVQEELEKYYLENSEAKEQHTVLAQEKAKIAQEKKALDESLASVKNQLEVEKKGLQSELQKREEALNKAQESSAKDEAALSEENNLLLTQLHHVQEELEKYYLENQSLKEKVAEEKRYYGAADRVKSQLGYRLGAKMIESSKSFFGILGLPLSLRRVTLDYKKEQKVKKDQHLPDIESYADAYEAERVKKHLSYMLGETTLKTMKNPLGIFVLPFRLRATHKAFKQSREQ